MKRERRSVIESRGPKGCHLNETGGGERDPAERFVHLASARADGGDIIATPQGDNGGQKQCEGQNDAKVNQAKGTEMVLPGILPIHAVILDTEADG